MIPIFCRTFLAIQNRSRLLVNLNDEARQQILDKAKNDVEFAKSHCIVFMNNHCEKNPRSITFRLLKLDEKVMRVYNSKRIRKRDDFKTEQTLKDCKTEFIKPALFLPPTGEEKIETIIPKEDHFLKKCYFNIPNPMSFYQPIWISAPVYEYPVLYPNPNYRRDGYFQPPYFVNFWLTDRKYRQNILAKYCHQFTSKPGLSKV